MFYRYLCLEIKTSFYIDLRENQCFLVLIFFALKLKILSINSILLLFINNFYIFAVLKTNNYEKN